MHRLFVIPVFALALVGLATSQVPPPKLPVQPPPKQQLPPQPPPKPWSLPKDAIAIAQADAVTVQQVDPTALPFTRWIWLQEASFENYLAVCDVLNKISQSSVIIKPPLIGGLLVRVDIRHFFPKIDDLALALGLFENYRFDPNFSLIITPNTIKLLTEHQRSVIKTSTWKTVRTWNEAAQVWQVTGRKKLLVSVGDAKDLVAERVNADHLADTGLEMLQAATFTEAPVIHFSYFTARAISTIKDKDDGKDTLYSLVYGGLYSDFRKLRKAQAPFKTDLDQFFFDQGVTSKDENFKQLFERLRSDEAAVMTRSKVTGKPRRILWVATRASRLSTGIPAMFITEDVRRQDIDLNTRAYANLLNPFVKALEIIWVLPNGMNGFALFDGDGNLLEKGADDVVSDHRIPDPETTELQAGISCIRCHGSAAGWIDFSNAAPKVPIRGDISQVNTAIPDTLDRINGLYGAPDFSTKLLLTRLKQDYNRAVLHATDNWGTKDKPNVTAVVEASSAQISSIYYRDRYLPVTAAVALQRLGEVPAQDPDPEKAKAAQLAQLNALLPPDTAAQIGGLIPEDPRIAELKAGNELIPSDFDLSYPFMLDRVLRNKKAQGGAKK